MRITCVFAGVRRAWTISRAQDEQEAVREMVEGYQRCDPVASRMLSYLFTRLVRGVSVTRDSGVGLPEQRIVRPCNRRLGSTAGISMPIIEHDHLL